MKRCWYRFILGGLMLFWLPGCGRSSEPPLRIAAAADLLFAMEELVAVFADMEPDVEVEVIFGSSGNMAAQLQQQAPYDLFFSANREYPAQLVRRGLVEDSALFPYAYGRLALWARRDAELDVEAMGMEVLGNPAIKTIAVANPRHAPYGVAAIQALENAGWLPELQSRMVWGNNVAQAAQFVQSGAADIGVIALPLAWAPILQEQGVHFVIPEHLFGEMEQVGVILSWTRQPAAARAFRDHVLSPAGRDILSRYGFGLPEEPAP